MTRREMILETFPDETFLFADGFDEAIIGVDVNSMRIVYSLGTCIMLLIDEGMTEEEAKEHLDFNVVNAYVGEKTPIWCDEITMIS